MHGNAATVAHLLVIVAFATRGEAVAAGLRKPSAPAAPPPVAQPAAPVAAAAKAVVEPSPAVVHRALVAAGKTYEALTKAAAAPVPQATRLDQAKQLVAQLHTATQKAEKALQVTQKAEKAEKALPAKQDSSKHAAPAVKAALAAAPLRGRRVELDAQLKEAEEQESKNEKEIKVQAGLAKEKEVAAAKAQKREDELSKSAKKLRKEADVAADIAKEKSNDAMKAEKGRQSTDIKVKNLLVEEHEMQHVLNQTEKQEIVLENNITSLKLQESKLPPAPPAKGAKTSPAVALKATQPLNQEAIQKLVDENNKLKHEKAMLEQQLSDRKVAKEKAKLKQKLKNRLALADRHMKMRKRVMVHKH